jgi:hypothetical protein
VSRPYNEKFTAICDQIAKDLVDRGLLIRAGAKVLLGLKLPQNREEALRYAFFAGADHVFSTLMRVLDEGVDATEADMLRMTKIHEELEEWRKVAYALLEDAPKGHA